MAYVNPLMGQMDPETQKYMQMRALMAAGGALAGTPGSFGQGMNAAMGAAMGSFDQSMQQGLQAQREALQRKNMEQQMAQREQQMGLQREQAGIQREDRARREELAASMARDYLSKLETPPSQEQLNAVQLLQNNILSGGAGMPGQVSNILFPSGRSGQGMFSGLLGGEQMPQSMPQPQMQQPPRSAAEAIDRREQARAAKGAAMQVQQQNNQLNSEISAMGQRYLGTGQQGLAELGGMSKEAATDLVTRLEGDWQNVNQQNRSMIESIIQILKDKHGL